MSSSRGGGAGRELRLRLAAHPASVRGARRFVQDGLHEWGHEKLVNDAAMCLTELTSNATLDAIRISVWDEGTRLIEVFTPQPARPSGRARTGESGAETEYAAGRGLSTWAG